MQKAISTSRGLAELTEFQRRSKALRFASQIEDLARKCAPDALTELLTHQLATKIRNRNRYSPAAKMEIIERFVKERADDPEYGWCSPSDVAGRFGWRLDEVCELVAEMITTRRLGVLKLRPIDKKGRGRPPKRLIIPPSGHK